LPEPVKTFMYRSMQKAEPPCPTKAPRGRPRSFDRETALAEATRLFWRKGYEATSIADLTGAIGIGAPSLYAAFGSKEALYQEALAHYARAYGALVWDRFLSADSAREALAALLEDSAAALTGTRGDILKGCPRGCMVTLSSVAGDQQAALAETLRAARGLTLERLEARLERAVAEGELPPSTDIHALARYIQTVQSGMSILARDAAGAEELAAVAELAMRAYDAAAPLRAEGKP